MSVGTLDDKLNVKVGLRLLPETKELPSELAAYRDLFQKMLDSALLVTPDLHLILEANAACERLLGVPPEKLIGQPLTKFIQSPSAEVVERYLRMARRSYYPRRLTSRWRRHDGVQVIMDLVGCRLELRDQSTVLQVIAHDITHRWEEEQRTALLVSELKDSNEKLEQLATIDEMTGLYNFRHFKTELEITHSRCVRANQPYSIVFCDIDHFKNYNDTNGHPAGDKLLTEIGKILRGRTRGVDIAARYGGEEFAVICPFTSWEGASVLAEYIRAAVESANLPFAFKQPGGKLTLSIGVASFPAHADDSRELLERADEALYHSKTSGRNRVTSAQELDPVEPTQDGNGNHQD